VIDRFYIGERYCILHSLGNKKDNLAEFNLADFRNSPNRQNKFYIKFSSYAVLLYICITNYSLSLDSNTEKTPAQHIILLLLLFIIL